MAYKKTEIYTCESPIAGKQVYFKSNQDMTGLGASVTGASPFTPSRGTQVNNGFCEANSPKIPRISVVVGNRKKTTLCSPTVADAQGNTVNRNLLMPKRTFKQIASATAKVVSCYVEIYGIKYAWNMPRWQYDKITGELDALGIKVATRTDEDTLVWGASAPKPARVQKFDSAGEDGGNTYGTFCSLAKENDLPEGWTIVSGSVNVADFLLK